MCYLPYFCDYASSCIISSEQHAAEQIFRNVVDSERRNLHRGLACREESRHIQAWKFLQTHQNGACYSIPFVLQQIWNQCCCAYSCLYYITVVWVEAVLFGLVQNSYFDNQIFNEVKPGVARLAVQSLCHLIFEPFSVFSDCGRKQRWCYLERCNLWKKPQNMLTMDGWKLVISTVL